jgi:4-amino-4-deoxy-L-arabinose transferase-like glycosyltransferase
MAGLRLYILVGIILAAVFFTCLFSMKDDALTMDEVAHLPAGYSYLTQKDMRLNPEHPPLIKDLAAIPLLFIKDIKFPSELKAWQEDVNGQWDFGFNFLYQTGNPADKMIFWGRIPMILILVLLGFYIFKWTRELFGLEGKPSASYGAGNKAALLALFLFAFSPTFLAHGRLITTDVAAATGVFIATYYFIKALQNSSKRNIIFAGISFGIAELCKFSVILLVPFFAILTLAWVIVHSENRKKLFKKFLIHTSYFLLLLVIGYLLIWPIYQYHVWNYPPERQVTDSKIFLKDYPDILKKPILWASDKPILRPYAYYLTGLFMVFHRAAFGHTTFFMGEVSNLGWKNYFPIVYLIKEPIPFHLLTLIALLYAAWLIKRPFWKSTLPRISEWIRVHFPEFAMLTFIVLYWATSLISSLNIGVRHLLPVFPFTMILVAAMTAKWLKPPLLKWKFAFLGILILWQLFSIIRIYPHFLSYCNQLAGGPNQCYLYTVNSNLDWGQDLKRLTKWVENNKIEKIYIDYFGGGDPKYYLKEKFAPWWGARDPKELPKGSYLAVSATSLQGGRGEPAPGFNQQTGFYNWLNNYRPITKIGYSIFVYYIP